MTATNYIEKHERTSKEKQNLNKNSENVKKFECSFKKNRSIPKKMTKICQKCFFTFKFRSFLTFNVTRL